MAIELGKAYVQILPSAKGISGSIQKAIAPEATAAGKSAGRNIASAISDSLSKAGSAMTKYITAPAMTAATAVSGLVGALGFKRLIGMDEARAKLKGLGIEGKQLEIVMQNARDAVTGTTHTLADGASVAAGALAAGVKPGKELERYIRLVGDAATGANAPMSEMAMIFNRIQGTGKIARTELDMLEYRLPGFSKALMEHVGAKSQEAFFEMVSAGKVSSKEVLDTMETFAGGMSAAYAETWSGLKDNILANIGIIGEALLQGLFEDGKKGMAEFLQVLRESESLKEWARSTGETLRTIFRTIANAIKSVVSWWATLDDSTKKAILTFMGIAVVAGPIMTVVGKLIKVFTTVGGWIDKIKNGFVLLKGAMAGISAPVLIAIGAIAGLIAIFVGLYKTNEDFRNMVHTVWEGIKTTITTVIQAVSGFVMQIFGSLATWWKENGNMILQAARNVWTVISTVIMAALKVILAIMKAVWPVVKSLVITTWNAIKGAIEGAIKVITGIIQLFSALFTGDWSKLWDAIKKIVSGAVQFVWNLVNLWIVGRVIKLAKVFFSGLRGLFSSGFNVVRNITSTALNAIKNFFSKIFNGLKNIVSNSFSKVRDAVSKGINKALEIVRKIKDKFFDAGKNIIQGLFKGISSKVKTVVEKAKEIGRKVVDGFKSVFKIASPSKVMIQIGKWVGDGFVKGLSGTTKKVSAATKKIADEAIKNLKIKFDTLKINPTQYIESLKKVAKQYKLTSNQARTIQKEVHRAKNTIASAVTKINKETEKANTQLLTKIQKINSQLQKDINKLKSDFQKQVAETAQSIYNQVKLFDTITVKEISGETLLKNLKQQNEVFKQWQSNLNKIAKSGAPKAFVDELRSMGVDAAGEIAAIANMTKEQLNEYVKAWKEKHSLAKSEANIQLADQKKQMEQQIKELTKAAQKEIDKAKKEWKNSLSKLSSEVAKLGSFKDSGKVLGKDTVNGIISGLKSMTGPLKEQAQKLAKSIEKEIKKVLKIKSPSQLMRDEVGKMIAAGIGVGIEKGESYISRAMERALSFDLTKRFMFSNPYGYYNGIHDITIHNTFTAKEMTPSEIARKQKQQLRELALGW